MVSLSSARRLEDSLVFSRSPISPQMFRSRDPVFDQLEINESK